MKIDAVKNGRDGILNRTNDPKFATVNPTEKAKNRAKSIANITIGFFLI